MTRILVGAVLVAALLFGTFWSPLTCVVLYGLICGVCIWEFLGVAIKGNNSTREQIRRVYGTLVGLIPYVLTALYYGGHLEQIVLSDILVTVFLILFVSFIFELFAKAEQPFMNVAYILLAMFYIGGPMTMIQYIAFHGGGFHPGTVFGMFGLVAVNDSFAYLIGSRIGKRPFFNRISPNKTLEGFIGGVVMTMLLAPLFPYVLGELSVQHWVALAGLAAVFGTAGDLTESMFKRSMKIKDTSNILPGHGGFLDRFDALLFLVPFVAFYLSYFKPVFQ